MAAMSVKSLQDSKIASDYLVFDGVLTVGNDQGTQVWQNVRPLMRFIFTGPVETFARHLMNPRLVRKSIQFPFLVSSVPTPRRLFRLVSSSLQNDAGPTAYPSSIMLEKSFGPAQLVTAVSAVRGSVMRVCALARSANLGLATLSPCKSERE